MIVYLNNYINLLIRVLVYKFLSSLSFLNRYKIFETRDMPEYINFSSIHHDIHWTFTITVRKFD